MVKKVNVLYVHQDGNLSASAISLRNLLQALDREQFQPRVLLGGSGTTGQSEMDAQPFFESLGIPVDTIPIKGFWTAPGTPWYRGDYYRNFLALFPNPPLMKYLTQQNVDLIHINDKAMLSAGLAASRLGLPIVWHLRSTYRLSHSRMQALISRFGIKRSADHLIAISEDEADGFEDFPNLHIIHNSVDWKLIEQALPQRDKIRAEFGCSSDEIVIGMVGFLSEVKGAWDFILAAGQVCAALPNHKLRFVIVAPIPKRMGSMGLSEKLNLSRTNHAEDHAWQLARQAGIEDKLIITGYRTDVFVVIGAFDIAVSCYRLRAIGRPAFEAMAMGKPLVVTPGYTGRSQVVVDGETALVVPPGDLQALANAIVTLARDPELRQQMGESGMLYSRKHFDPERNARAVEQVYQLALQTHQAKKGE